MAKSVCDFIKADGVTSKLNEMSIDEITELAIYDCPSKMARKELLAKKLRKVHVNTPVTVRFILKNPLNVGLHVKNITLVCKGQ
jgi:hypothetical protein